MSFAKASATALAKILAGWACCALVVFFSLESFDRLFDSSFSFALSQAYREASARPDPLVEEARSLAQRVAEETGIPSLALLRFGRSERLHSYGFRARFNPATFRVSLSPELLKAPVSERRLVILHEISHAIALSEGYAVPDVSSLRSDQAREIVSRSLLARQLFHESFADSLSVILALRLAPSDSAAWGAIAQALGKPALSSSPAYETFIALRETNRRMGFLSGLPSARLPSEARLIASEAVPLAIAHLRAEREAACYMGPRSAARFLANLGYASAMFPWDMARTGEIRAGEPFAEGLLELSALRERAPRPHAWAEAMRYPSIRSSAAALAEMPVPSSKAASHIARGMRIFLGQAAPSNESAFAAWLARGLSSRSETPAVFRQISSSLLFSGIFGNYAPEGCSER